MSENTKHTIKKTRKRKKKQWPFIIIFILGLLVLSYPLVSRFYYRVESTQQVKSFDNKKKELTADEIKNRIDLARAYNKSLINLISTDPYVKKQLEAGRKEYGRMLEINEQMGHIEIPKLDVDIPIYAGTNEEVLQKGAGHLEGTSLPVGGASTHTVITAHSGLPTAKLFTDLSKLKMGDKFFIHNLSQVLAYEVDRIKTVEPSNFSDLLIDSNRDQATLLTCTPIMINTHRLLVRGHRVSYNPNEFVSMNKNNKLIFWLKVAGFILLIFLMALWLYRKTKKKAR
ncbi:class C sortase [Peptostreptococcus porci]|uniref:class C sortase n=1 Tax=Peptostreptococcus porci TaxID=2652282 RepID=UPI002A83BDDF|nr:class C sortase [Peptostreptococcus porci]MDY4128024.1 class C sortase [Peptostreptococcus porci]